MVLATLAAIEQDILGCVDLLHHGVGEFAHVLVDLVWMISDGDLAIGTTDFSLGSAPIGDLKRVVKRHVDWGRENSGGTGLGKRLNSRRSSGRRRRRTGPVGRRRGGWCMRRRRCRRRESPHLVLCANILGVEILLVLPERVLRIEDERLIVWSDRRTRGTVGRVTSLGQRLARL